MGSRSDGQGREYVVYRGHGQTMKERLQRALAMYRTVYRDGLPLGIVVNPREEEAAHRALKALNMEIPVYTLGGCLVPEIWFVVAEGNEG